jgi:poly(3-hydroxybutyrate) depolymerase
MKAYMLRISTVTLFTLTLAVACACSIAHAQQVVADFSAGPPSGQYSFPSWTPKTLPELIKGNSSGESVKITGHLFLPPGTEKVPAVVLIHGSGGIYNAMLDFWPKRFNTEGIAVLAVDSFGPRGVKSTAEDQSQVPFTADVADAFAALKLLASHPRIDPGRIAVMGFSRGGITAWRTSVERIITGQKLPNGIALCGACAGLLRWLCGTVPP